MMTSEPFDFTSGGLRLEGRIHAGKGSMAAVVLHPHPQYGGDMDNHVVVACCDALASAGVAALRFNFRGAGRSEGTYDEGRGEQDDAIAAMAAMRERHPDAGVLLVGYSFGAMIAASVSNDAVVGLALISPPTAASPLPALAPELPALIATGDQDHVSPSENVAGMASDRIQICVFEGVDHGWWPGIDELATALVAFARGLCEGAR